MRNICLKLFILTIIFVIFSGCVSMMEKTGRVLDGSAFVEKTTVTYKTDTSDIELSIVVNKAGEESIIISLKNFPMMKIRGFKPDENGIFHLTSLEYLAGNTHGWNEFSLQIMGEGTLILGETVVMEILDIEFVQITQARIHRYDTRITGNDALTAMRNRHERILSLGEWMISQDAPKAQSLGVFNNYWKPLLFPEMVSKKRKPSNFLQDGDEFKKAEDIRWNTGYTKRILPQELWPIRDSGTLLRDWEEALSWIYLEYEWENIMELLSKKNNMRS